MNWKDLQELMQSERSRSRRTLYTGSYTVVKSNVMDSFASSNALIQGNYAGTYEKEHYSHAEEELQEWKHRRKTTA